VNVIYEATKESAFNKDVQSNPREKDTDGDNIPDFDEYKNVTDPDNVDTDGDGKNDEVELWDYEDSSPTGIDGIPPKITKLDKSYKIKWGGFLGVIPQGVQLELKVTVQDDFGVKWVNVKVKSLGEKRLYFDDEQKVTGTFKFDIGVGQADRFLYKGFKINVTACDRNENLGYKEAEMPGIINMILSALLGALKAFAKFITELVSGIINWILDAVKNIIYSPLNCILQVINSAATFIDNLISPLADILLGRSEESLLGTVFELVDGLSSNPLFFAMILIDIVIGVISLLSLPYINIFGVIITLVVDLSLPIILTVLGSALGGIFEDIAEIYTNPLIAIVNIFDTLGIFSLIDEKSKTSVEEVASSAINIGSVIIGILAIIIGVKGWLIHSGNLDKVTEAFNAARRKGFWNGEKVIKHKKIHDEIAEKSGEKTIAKKIKFQSTIAVVLGFMGLSFALFQISYFLKPMDKNERYIKQLIFIAISIAFSGASVYMYKKAKDPAKYLKNVQQIPKWIVNGEKIALIGSLIFNGASLLNMFLDLIIPSY
jgi:hypothetical protein